MKGRNHLEEPGVYGIISKWILNEWDKKV